MSGLAQAFADALRSRGGTPHLVADSDAARAVLADLCDGQAVVADDDPVLAPLVDGLRRVEDPWTADVGVTTAVAAAARTSTLALAFDAAHPRRTSLVPPVHVAVVPVERLVETYPQALAALGALSPPPSGMRLVSGPSSSGDIEQVHIRGMHGPVQVHVLLVGAAEAEPAVEPVTQEEQQPVAEQEMQPVAEPVAEAAPDESPAAAASSPPVIMQSPVVMQSRHLQVSAKLAGAVLQ